MDRAAHEELETVRDYFRKAGLRWTRQRQVIVEQAFLTHDHFTAEELLEMVRERAPETTIHLATIYRTLLVLEKGHFVEGLEVGKGRVFEHIFGHEHHDHVICLDCGRILEFRDMVMERHKGLAAQQLGFRMRRHSLRIYGSCERLASTGHCEHYPEA